MDAMTEHEPRGAPRVEDHRDRLERMVTEQPRRLTNRMLPAVRNRARDPSGARPAHLRAPARLRLRVRRRRHRRTPTASVATSLGISEDLVRWRRRRGRLLLRERIDADA